MNSSRPSKRASPKPDAKPNAPAVGSKRVTPKPDQPLRVLVVAEKPSVARDLARVLSARTTGDGCLTGGGYVVTWAVGHLVTLREPDEINPQWKRWRDVDLPIIPTTIPLKVIPQTKSQYAIVKNWMQDPSIERIICATDAGREGELIFRYIYQMAGCQKPFDRLWISSMTDEAIREGFARLRPGTSCDALYESARCRSEADWLVGMNASRAFTLRYNVLLSIGRVQTPTLALLARRRKAIDAFVPKPYWIVTADFGDYTGNLVDPQTKEPRVWDAATAQAAADAVRGKPARVDAVEKSKKTDLPPQLLDLTNLQREANRLLGLTAKQTLEAAQSLYEKHKLITYPRTDSRYLTDDLRDRLPGAMKGAVSAFGELSTFIAPILAQPLPRSSRVFDAAKVSDHHAILPTGKTSGFDKLTPEERGVYGIVCKNLAAAFSPSHVYEQTRVTTSSIGHSFISTGRVVIQNGWKAVYKRNDSPSGEQTLPALAVGDTRVVRDVVVKEDKTKPPAPLTDSTLLAAMEHAGREIEDEALREAMRAGGLGTPATRAATIERLIQVGYAERRGKTIVATDKGMRLIEVVPGVVAEPELTGKWEKALSDIAAGHGSVERFREAARKMAARLVQQARESRAQVVFDAETPKPSNKTYRKSSR
ncbi:MAG: DNA topoisomerase 3 [Oscillospiraceae bacterium]|jgi:DNA topoisomerase-3|nr:DNA topoisomerase 3 [Oscillospiraceae bacterium]